MSWPPWPACASIIASSRSTRRECPGCDGSSRAFVEVLDQAGIVEQDRMRQVLVLESSVVVREGDAVLAANPGAAAG